MAEKVLTLDDLNTKAPNAWKVDPETCIGCRACSDSYGDAFGFDDDANVAVETAITEPGKHNPDEVIQICPSDSIFIPGYVGNPTAQGGQWAGNTGDEEVAVGDEDDDSPFETVLRPSAAPAEVREDEAGLPEPIFGGMKQKVGLALAMPLLGALPPLLRKEIEDRVQDELYFSGSQAAAFNMVANLFIYSFAAVALVFAGGGTIFSLAARVAIFQGLMLASAEAAFRFMGGSLWYRGKQQEFILGAIYTLPVTIAYSVWRMVQRNQAHLNRSPFTRLWADGSEVGDKRHMADLELDRDRKRRYGNVYEIQNTPSQIFIRVEMPRSVPEHPEREKLGLGRAMPHYEYEVKQDGNVVTLRARVPDGEVKRLISRVNSFPPSMRKNFFFEEQIKGYEVSYDAETYTLSIAIQKSPSKRPAMDKLHGHTDAMNRAA